MLSSVALMQSDMHHIFNLDTRERLNKGKDIIIGNHVWLGRENMLMGVTQIADSCILGARTTTSGKFYK